MNILLATYSYYPYNYGGTEVYVSGLAAYLREQGHEITIIAGMPPDAFHDHPIFFEDEQLKTIEYVFDSIKIIGVVLKNRGTTEIYKKFRKQWVDSWLLALTKITRKKWDVLHIHANTSAIGLSLIKAVKLHSNNINTIASYHVPVTCVKGTLMFANKMEACKVAPAVGVCSACVISDKQNLPLSITKKIVSFLPVLASENFPTSIRIKFLINQFLAAFRNYDNEVDLWHVFSDQIRTVLQLNAVPEEKILLLRHGVNPYFFLKVNERTTVTPLIFFYAGRHTKLKGFCTMIEAWCSLPSSGDRVLWITGENQTNDPDVAKCIRLTSERNDIKWLGTRSQEEVAMFMKKVHCTIIPSEWIEIGPLVFHEAIAAGSDVIASDIGGCKELAMLYRTKSQLFEAGNMNSLATSIHDFRYSGLTEIPSSQLENYRDVSASYSRLMSHQDILND